MKKILLALMALSLALPAFADSGDVPENFEEAILRESAGDQGVDSVAGEEQGDELPAGFEDAILRESAADQGIDMKVSKKKIKKKAAATAKKGKQKIKKATAKRESDEDFLRRMAMINDIFGEYPSTEEECRKTTDDPIHFQTCMEMGPEVVSSNNARNPANLKKEGHRAGDQDGHKASMVFEAN